MADDTPRAPESPRGFGEGTRGLTAEYAHEQGWGLDEAERRKLPEGPQDTDGGTDYEYGARDFGDDPVNTAIDHGKTGAAEQRSAKNAPQEQGADDVSK